MVGNLQEFDYVVIGAGAAGCTLASRIAERSRATVAVIEAGASDRNPLIRIPIGFARLMNDPKLNWGDMTEPEPGLAGRRIVWPRGKVLGGSGSINGLVFLRGWSGDFDEWRRLGADGWGYSDVLPYFRRLETNLAANCDDGFHGEKGPIPVSRIEAPSDVAQAFVDAAVELGYRRNLDFNGRDVMGAGFNFLNTQEGLRRTTAAGYLRPALSRSKNLALFLKTAVKRIVIEDGRAIGVLVRLPSGEESLIRARGEVVLCAGAVNSPQLLQLSGIGDSAKLAKFGIVVSHHLPGVGENLQDHLLGRFVFKSRSKSTLNQAIRNPLRLAEIGLRFLVNRTGPLSISASEASLFVRAAVPDAVDDGGPNLQFQVANFSMDNYASGLHPFPGFVYSATVCRPESRGSIHIRSSDSDMRPAIFANYLTAESDRRTMLAGFRLGRALATTKALSALIEAELRPSPDAISDEAILEYVRATASTVFHPCGTCRIGKDDLAVVDPELRVHGIAGLRVIDASVMPTIPSTNIHAATIMIAEKGAEVMTKIAHMS